MPKDSPISVPHRRFIDAIRQLQQARPELRRSEDVARFMSVGDAVIGVGTIEKILAGINAPTVNQCMTLCEVAGVNANWLFGLETNLYRNAGQIKPLQLLRAAVAALEDEAQAPAPSIKKSNNSHNGEPKKKRAVA